MNMNRRTLRVTACCMVTAFSLMASPAATFAASPTAGASSAVAQAVNTTTSTEAAATPTAATSGTVTAGISSSLSTVVATAEQSAKDAIAAAEVQQNAAPETKSEYTDIAIAQVDNYVNVRSTPSEDGEVVGKLYNNSAATVNATEGDWYQITSGDVTGYVKSQFVVTGNEELAKKVSRRVATVHTETLKVRLEPSTDAGVLGLVPDQEQLTVTDDSMASTGWVKVSIEEGDGYVSTDYVSLSTEYVTAESKAAEERRLAKEEAERKKADAAAKSKVKSSKAASGSKSASAPSGSGGSSVVNYAMQFVGNPYVFGGTSLTNGADCSGFVLSVYAAFGVSLPHSSSAMRGVGYEVSPSEMQPGDIVCYSGHVAIYAGNNTIVHASTPETGIKVSSPANYRQILSVRRIF